MQDDSQNVIDLAKARREQETTKKKNQKLAASKKADAAKIGVLPRWLIWLQFIGLLFLMSLVMQICTR
jgi:hypothetical protein